MIIWLEDTHNTSLYLVVSLFVGQLLTDQLLAVHGDSSMISYDVRILIHEFDILIQQVPLFRKYDSCIGKKRTVRSFWSDLSVRQKIINMIGW